MAVFPKPSSSQQHMLAPDQRFELMLKINIFISERKGKLRISTVLPSNLLHPICHGFNQRKEDGGAVLWCVCENRETERETRLLSQNLSLILYIPLVSPIWLDKYGYRAANSVVMLNHCYTLKDTWVGLP